MNKTQPEAYSRASRESLESDGRANGGDPTQNVLDLVIAANQRQDDLRDAQNRFMDAEGRHSAFVAELRAKHAEEIRKLDTDRLAAIRNVDGAAAKTESDRAQQAIQALAAIQATNAETLRNALNTTAATIAKQTADTATAIAKQNSDTTLQLDNRISSLEKSSYTGMGRQTVSDPMMTELLQEMKAVRSGTSRGDGANNQVALGRANSQWLIAAVVVPVVLAVGAIATALILKG